MPWALRIAALLVSLGVSSIGFLGIAALVQRDWRRGLWLGLATIGAVLAFIVGIGVVAIGLGHSMAGEGRARLVAETISTMMNWGALAWFALLDGVVVSIVGTVGWFLHRQD